MNTILEMSGVSVRFGGVVALDGVGFSIPAAGATALIGPNGAGKTTCFNVISGFQFPNSGSVNFAGRNVTRIAPHRRTGIGRTFQRIALVPEMSVRENVMLGFHGRAVGSFFKTGLGAPSVRDSERRIRVETNALLAEYDLDAVADRPAATLPLGLQRLVEIARARAQQPRLMLLDEAASGLDLAELDLIAHRISQIRAGGCALLIVEHDMRFVTRVAEKLIVLHYGRVIFDGTVAAGMEDERVRAAYLGAARKHDA
jgi:branched-chain amino acid transport system ATP-binding protein